ncbi:hypothetical protein [Vulcanisaeta souniana]|uniref:hypothetical protein n=1 Tax=Vulcanisaeta souniana TaxID=164452 RepID=UPI000B053ADB|nr:hypothetical protein [Vulcanisaeta souniana]
MPVREHLDIVMGNSQYLDDIKMDNMVYLHVIRSPYARARVLRIDSSSTKFLLFLTANYIGNLLMPSMPVSNARIIKMPVLSNGTVNFIGQPVAAVVTDSTYALEDVVERYR